MKTKITLLLVLLFCVPAAFAQVIGLDGDVDPNFPGRIHVPYTVGQDFGTYDAAVNLSVTPAGVIARAKKRFWGTEELDFSMTPGQVITITDADLAVDCTVLDGGVVYTGETWSVEYKGLSDGGIAVKFLCEDAVAP